MMFAGAGAGAGALFDGGGFMPSQAPELTTSPSKSRGGAQRLIPLTVKQIREAFDSSDDKYNLVVEGSNVKLLGLVMNKIERVTDVSFTLDDGTGRIEISRWMNEIWDSNEVAGIQNGMYVKVNGHVKGFQRKQAVVAFSVRPVINFNDIPLHFLECIHVHMDITREKGGMPAQTQVNPTMTMMRTPFPNVLNAYQVSQHPEHSGMSGSSNDIYNMVLGVLREPSSLACEHGLHINEIVRRVGLPITNIMEVINYHVDSGHIYSTIDENHFKSVCDG